MAYVPMSHQTAVSVRAGQDPGSARGCAATRSLIRALGVDSSADEADFAALSNAGVLAVIDTSDPQRLVLAADVDSAQVSDRHTPFGEVEVSGLRWSQVTSLFADEPAAVEVVAAARRATGSAGGVAEALATSAVEQLLDTYDLLWFAVDELDRLG